MSDLIKSIARMFSSENTIKINSSENNLSTFPQEIIDGMKLELEAKAEKLRKEGEAVLLKAQKAINCGVESDAKAEKIRVENKIKEAEHRNHRTTIIRENEENRKLTAEKANLELKTDMVEEDTKLVLKEKEKEFQETKATLEYKDKEAVLDMKMKMQKENRKHDRKCAGNLIEVKKAKEVSKNEDQLVDMAEKRIVQKADNRVKLDEARLQAEMVKKANKTKLIEIINKRSLLKMERDLEKKKLEMKILKVQMESFKKQTSFEAKDSELLIEEEVRRAASGKSISGRVKLESLSKTNY